ncbi:MAG: glycerol-3-phosphate dehydrogenase/oxidase [Verrucomicrobiales bacterium]|nr:glycerol-3-phosphate dehydrogenase/oxidase [Verrucomicrobiales bacterium]MCP5527709.1 glycerol-3-phosphate dehydrogenase/oxidase [Verrucomicrobiales bacterium]
MNREQAIAQLDRQEVRDVLVIGGGATGLGCAVDAAARGYRTLLLEQADFAKGTSSRSTKLIHGGVRYLKQGNVSLVLEALRERGLLCRNAPHLVHHLPFIVPVYNWWEGPFYGIGLKLYDRLAGQLGLGASRNLSREETLREIPTIEREGLKGGVRYFDGQFDDSRLAVHLARTVFDLGGLALNHFPVVRLTRSGDLLDGVVARDAETGREYEVRAKAIINATGVFADTVRRLDDADCPPVLVASQGIHLVLPRRFLPGDSAIMVPHTSDGRVLFAVPWHDRVIVGTTDVPAAETSLEPRASEAEIGFVLTNAARYLVEDPQRKDVLSVFAGLRPLIKAANARSTAALSRDHSILISDSGLITVTGGKWTTYRKMAEDAVDHAEAVAGLGPRPCPTGRLKLRGWTEEPPPEKSWAVYGADAASLRALLAERPELGEPLHPRLPISGVEVVWAVREEMARTIEDVLSRRTRALLLDARASLEAAPRVAALMAQELGRDAAWQQRAVADYADVARHYVLD